MNPIILAAGRSHAQPHCSHVLPVCLVTTAVLAGCAGVPVAVKPPAPQTIVMAVIDDAFYVGFATPQGATGSSLEIVSQSQGVASLTYGFGDKDAQPLLLVPATIPIPATDPNELTRIDHAAI